MILLAVEKVSHTVVKVASHSTWLGLPTHWPAQGDLLTWAESMGPATAALLILAGVVYLTCGYYVFKVLVTLNAAFVGGYFGLLIGQSRDADLIGALVGASVASLVAWPLMKYAVAIMGGTFGAVLGAGFWHTCGLNPQFAWSGAVIGLVGFGMLSFILFRGSIIMYTSLQGSVMLVCGILGLIYKYKTVGPQITSNMTMKPFLLPICIFIPAMIGLIYQQSSTSADAKK